MQVGLHVQEGNPANVQYGEGLAKVQLLTKDGTRLVGVGPDVLSVHMLRPIRIPLAPREVGVRSLRPALQPHWRHTERWSNPTA